MVVCRVTYRVSEVGDIHITPYLSSHRRLLHAFTADATRQCLWYDNCSFHIPDREVMWNCHMLSLV